MIVPTILAQAVAIYIFYERHWENVSRHLASSLAGEITLVVNYIENAENDEEVRVQKFLDTATTLFGMHVLTVDDNKAEKYLEGYRTLDHEIYTRKLGERIEHKFEVYQDKKETEIATLIYLEEPKTILIKVSDKRLINSTTYIFIMWMTGTTALLMLISIVFLKNQIRPIIRLARLANNFGRGQEIPPNFKPEGAREVKQAANAFLNMKARISRHIKQRTEMLAGISHDLRTPLTRMKLEIEMIKEKYNDENISELSHDIEDMERMVSSYINFVRADEEEETEIIELEDFLEEIVKKYKAQGFGITLNAEDDISIAARERALRRAIINLIENAIKYASSAKITLKEDMNYANITIDDNGPGIDKEEREEVFKPFHRVESSRNPDTGGTGLGLSIVKDIINGHGGSIVLDEVSDGKGLRVIIKLPL